MNLQRRFSIFALATVTLLSGAMGTFLIEQSYRQAINRIENEIRNIITAVEVASQDKVTTALAYARDAEVPVSIYLADGSNPPIPIFERGNGIAESQLIRLLSKSSTKTVTTSDGDAIGIVEIEGGSELLLLSPTDATSHQRNRSLTTMFFLLLIIFVAMLIALRLVVSRDIARERVLIETSERLRNETERRRLLIDFAGDASHELRTPLTVIKGYLELGQRSPSVLTNDETIGRLLSESSRMEQTISQLLEVFEIESLPQDDLHAVDLSSHLRKRLEIFIETNPQRDVNSLVEDGLSILATEELLDRIFGNLFNNIYRHTPTETSVKIVARKKDGQALVEFHDGGPGIENFGQTRLFSRFDKSRARDKGGSGLGLSIISAAVSRLNGEMTLGTSELGGLQTTLTFPIN